MSRNDGRIYVGNLPQDTSVRDIEDLFHKFGRINFVDLKKRRSPAFAFVEFEDPRDAEDAVAKRDGYKFGGERIRVEFPIGRAQPRGGGGGDVGRRVRATPRRSKFRVNVYGLPPSGSWQDLKDHFREAGDVYFADVVKQGHGVVEFAHYEGMKYALRKLNESKFRSHEGETAFIRVKEDNDSGGRRTPSRSRSRSRSHSASPVVRRGRRGRRSPSDCSMRSASRSRSRSLSQSR